MYDTTKGQCPKTSECKVPSTPLSPFSTDPMQGKASKPDNAGKK